MTLIYNLIKTKHFLHKAFQYNCERRKPIGCCAKYKRRVRVMIINTIYKQALQRHKP